MSASAINIYNEGYYYYTGTEGYPLNRAKSLEFFQKAAELGLSHAMNHLGILYENGEIVPQNYATAVSWFSKAVEADPTDKNALFNLGRMYYLGRGIVQNVIIAHEYLGKAIAACKTEEDIVYSKSCFIIGCIMIEYHKNYQDSYPYFDEAAKHGNIPGAWYNLGWLAEKGVIPVNKNATDIEVARDSMARQCYEKAAEQEEVAAMDALGRLYAKYNMMDNAKFWINKAASMGYETAKKRLKMLNFSQSGSIFDLFK